MKREKVFLDTEFTGLYQHASLISIGLISESGKRFYGEFTNFKENYESIDPWVKDNVIGQLSYNSDVNTLDIQEKTGVDKIWLGSEFSIAHEIKQWVSKLGYVEIWSDCLAYDWVLFCQLFGGAQYLPKEIFYIPFDISTLMVANGIDPDINREEFIGCEKGLKHNAMWDAIVIRKCYFRLMAMGRSV